MTDKKTQRPASCMPERLAASGWGGCSDSVSAIVAIVE